MVKRENEENTKKTGEKSGEGRKRKKKKKREQEERKYSEAGEYLMTGIGFLRQIKTPIIKRQIISPPMYWEEEEEEQEEEEGKEEEEKYKKEVRCVIRRE